MSGLRVKVDKGKSPVREAPTPPSSPKEHQGKTRITKPLSPNTLKGKRARVEDTGGPSTVEPGSNSSSAQVNPSSPGTIDPNESISNVEFYDNGSESQIMHMQVASVPLLKKGYRAGYYAQLARANYAIGVAYDPLVEDLVAFARIKLVGRQWNEATQVKFMQIMSDECDRRKLLVNANVSRLRLFSVVWAEFLKPGPMEMVTMAAQGFDMQKLLVAREQLIRHKVDNTPPLLHRFGEVLSLGLWCSPARLVDLPRA